MKQFFMKTLKNNILIITFQIHGKVSAYSPVLLYNDYIFILLLYNDYIYNRAIMHAYSYIFYTKFVTVY